jgi:hypothetical protein
MKRKIAGLLVGAVLVGGTLAYEIPQAHAATITITCSDGFSFTVNSAAAGGVAHALANYNANNPAGITCSAG